jgi:hydrogenase expression/formation protein HypE
MTSVKDFSLVCPAPSAPGENVLMAHGGGGRLMNELIEKVFLPAFDDPALRERHDAAVVSFGGARLAFSTDSFVVRPLFFPGGDIGSLAVNGTVNDLAMAGARPVFLSAGFILEEGLPMETLGRVAESMRRAAQTADVRLVTGDTKVVDRGKGDGVYINTAGIGFFEQEVDIAPRRVRPGDIMILNGDLGRHGMAVMSLREGLEFQSTIESDCAPLWRPVQAMLSQGIEVHCLRDLTRGGLASALNEIASASRTGLWVDETQIPVREDVRAACEILGLDPLYVANEGRFVAFVPMEEAERAVAALRSQPGSEGACVIGEVSSEPGPAVTLRTAVGVERVLDMLSGEQMPRIC